MDRFALWRKSMKESLIIEAENTRCNVLINSYRRNSSCTTLFKFRINFLSFLTVISIRSVLINQSVNSIDGIKQHPTIHGKLFNEYVWNFAVKFGRLHAQRSTRINPSHQISNKPQIPSFYHTRDYFWNTRVLAYTDLATPQSNSFNSVSNRKPDRPNLSTLEHVQCRAKVLVPWSILSSS